MNIIFNEGYSLEVNLKKCPPETPGDLFHLTLTQHSRYNKNSSVEYFFQRDQLKQFIEHLNEASRDYI